MALRFENLHDKANGHVNQMPPLWQSECHHACFIISFVPLSTNVYKDIYEEGISFAMKNSSIKHIANYITHFLKNYNIQYTTL